MNRSTLARALFVMDEVAKNAEGLRFSEVQSLLGNPSPTTVSKILKELTEADALTKTQGGRYVIGMKAYFWGKTASTRRGPMQLVRECMAELHERFEASVNLFTCSGRHMFCLESITSPQSPSLWPAGKSLPLQLPVIGSIFFYSREELADDAFLEAECSRHKPEPDPEAVRGMIRSAATLGVQYDTGLFYPGVYRLAVPLAEQGRTAMVLGLGLTEGQAKQGDALSHIASTLLDCKRRIERDMNA